MIYFISIDRNLFFIYLTNLLGFNTNRLVLCKLVVTYFLKIRKMFFLGGLMLKVLVIDDDPAMTEILEFHLTPEGMDVKVVNDGQNGIDLIEKIQPDIILLDLLMPELDGWEVCRAIKSGHQIPILILSAVDNPSRIADALNAGADDYLIKPVSAESLIAHINNLTRRTSKRNSPIYSQNVEISD